MLDSQNILLGSHNYPICWHSISFKNEKSVLEVYLVYRTVRIGEEYKDRRQVYLILLDMLFPLNHMGFY